MLRELRLISKEVFTLRLITIFNARGFLGTHTHLRARSRRSPINASVSGLQARKYLKRNWKNCNRSKFRSSKLYLVKKVELRAPCDLNLPKLTNLARETKYSCQDLDSMLSAPNERPMNSWSFLTFKWSNIIIISWKGGRKKKNRRLKESRRNEI